MTDKHPLIGAGVHWRDEDGTVELQAEVIDVFPNSGGDIVRLQFFSWIMGERSTQRLIPLAELAASERWVFYDSVERMNEHYELYDQHRSKLAQRRASAARDPSGAPS